MLVKQISSIEKDVFTLSHNGKYVDVKFQFGEFPNDMKMVAFLAGELSNSAKFFSSFADVSSGNGDNINGTFGNQKENDWKPWKYSDRLKVVKKVEEEKKKMSKKKLADSTKRSNITKLISSFNSRQEFVPPIRELVDRIHIEPLHLKNNACALAHRYLLNVAVSLSAIPAAVSNFSQISSSSPFSKYVKALRTECHLSRLSKNVIKWFNDTHCDGKSFDVRFTGKESRGFLHGFMFLIAAIEPFSGKGSQNEFTLHILSYFCLTLRDCVSLFNRLEISQQQVSDLEQKCKQFFKINMLFFPFHPTVWHLGHIVPVHVRDMKDKYDLGLAMNSMEGRESKHQSIARYSKNTIYHLRWQQIFRHEYVSLLWLRERGYNGGQHSSSRNLTYIPNRALHDPNYCYCGYHKEESEPKCVYCLHPHREKVVASVTQGKNLACTKKMY
jgi:hypothetical protein